MPPAPPPARAPAARLDLCGIRLLLVTGKGGVGKTTLSASLALAAARLGRKVLLVESGTSPQIPALLGIPPPTGPGPSPWAEGIEGFLLDPLAALDEYIQLRVRIAPIVRRFTHWSVYRYFTRAAPGLKELMTVGKLWDLDRQRIGRRPRWDLIILDGPPTGHVVSALEVPRVVIDTVRQGPLRSEALRLEQLLERPSTALLFVTTAEEMPVNETLEALGAARERLRIPLAPLVANALWPVTYRPEDLPALERLARRSGDVARLASAALFEAARVRVQQWHLGRLREESGGLPILPLDRTEGGGMDRKALDLLARQLLDRSGGPTV